jgi:AraC-like DNA-binding protein
VLALFVDPSRAAANSALATIRPAAAGGLPRWRALRVALHIEERVTSHIRLDEVAQIAGLSVSHFSRAFRCTFGTTPLCYVRSRRMDFAQMLMLSTDRSLADIAASCGMSDQAHFT